MSHDTPTASSAKTICSSAASYLAELRRLLDQIDHRPIDRLGELLFGAWQRDRQVLVIGNGGSASTASHYVTDLVKTASVPGLRRLRTLSLSDNPGLTTAIGNDIAFEDTFLFPLEAYARSGDLVIAISGSGRSANVVRALQWAREHGLTTVAVTGFDGGTIGSMVDLHVNIPTTNFGLLEDLHLSIGHMVSQSVHTRLRSASAS